MGKKIDQLDVYDDVNTDKSRKNLFEVSKNTGTYASPVYATDGSRKITQEQLREELNIKEYYIKDVVTINNGDTLELDKLNNIIISSNETFTLPTASISNVGKCIAIRHQGEYVATISGIAGGSIKLININECVLLQCVFDGVSTYDWFAISKSLDSKICSNSVTLASNTYNAKHNDNIEANAVSVGSDINITIPTAGIEGRVIYIYYPTGSPSAYVVNLIGGFSATLEQLDYFLLRDNGSYWEAISTSQNVATVEPAFNLSVPTGVCEGGILSINADPTKFNISDGFGYIADLYTDPDPANATITKVTWSGLTAQTVTNLATSTVSFIYINSAGAIVQGTTEPTDETLRDYIYIGQLGHSNLTSISTSISEPSVAQSPMSQLRDLWTGIGYINIGNEISANGANLSINKSNGYLKGLGLNFETVIKIPNNKNLPAQTLATIRRRTQTGGSGTNTTLDVLNYDLSGTVTTITGTKAQNQRVFLLSSGNIVIQYGQTLYNSLTDAIQGIETESFVKLENIKKGQLIAIISVTSNCTSLQDTSRARIKNVGKFGEVNVGAGSSSVSTLQQAYLNSVDPEIDTVNGAVSFKNGGANDTVDVIEVKNLANSQTFAVKGDGLVTLSGALNYATSVTLASSATTDIGNANSNNIIISGTTTITSFGTVTEGVVRMIRFSGALTLTHNATSLQLPNGTNITTQNGDTAIFRSLGSGNWICVSYKSVTALTNNRLTKWDGSKLVNSVLNDNGTGIYNTATLGSNLNFDLGVSSGASDLSTRPWTVGTLGAPISATAIGGVTFVNVVSNAVSGLYINKQTGGWAKLIDSSYANFTSDLITSGYLTTNVLLKNNSNTAISQTNQFVPVRYNGGSIIANMIASYDAGINIYKPFNGKSWSWLHSTGSYLCFSDGNRLGTLAGVGVQAGFNIFGMDYTGQNTQIKVQLRHQGVSNFDYAEAIINLNGSGQASEILWIKEPNSTSNINLSIVSNQVQLTSNDTVTVFYENIGGRGGSNSMLLYDRNYYYGTDGQVLQWKGSKGLALGSSTINASAQIHSQSTTKGSLAINVLTTVQRLAITSPATGLQVFDSDLLTLCTFNGGTNIEGNWKKYTATSLTGTYTPNTGISGTTRTTVTVTVTGAVVGQKVVANINDALRADFVTDGSWFLDMQSYVSATDTVTITFVLSTYTTFGATSSITVNVN